MGAPKNNEIPEKPKRGAPEKKYTLADIQKMKSYIQQSEKLDKRAEEYNKNGKRSAGMYALYLDERAELIKRYSGLIQKVLSKMTPEELKHAKNELELYNYIKNIVEENDRENRTIIPAEDIPPLTITHPDYKDALTTKENEYAYISRHAITDFDVIEENGQTRIEPPKDKKLDDKNETVEIEEIDRPLLEQFFSAAFTSRISHHNSIITVNYNKFFRLMGINQDIGKKSASRHYNNVMDKLKYLENLSGVILGGVKYLRVFSIIEIDNDKGTMTFTCPYLYKLCEEIMKSPTKIYSGKGIIYGITARKKPTFASAKNKMTCEVIERLIQGLAARGSSQHKNEPTIEYKITFSSLIEECELLKGKIKEVGTSAGTTILQRTFCGNNTKDQNNYILKTYIKEYTDLYEYYNNFTIDYNPPAMTTIKTECIIITHTGINPNYTSQYSKFHSMLAKQN